LTLEGKLELTNPTLALTVIKSCKIYVSTWIGSWIWPV